MGAESDLAIVTIHPTQYLRVTPGHEEDAQRLADALGNHVKVVADPDLVGLDPDLPDAPSFRMTDEPPEPRPEPEHKRARSHHPRRVTPR